MAADAFGLADKDAAQAVYSAIAAHTDEIADFIGRPEEVTVGGEAGGDLGTVHDWVDCMRLLQLLEAWQCHGEWISSRRPSFGPGVQQRFEAAARVDPNSADVAAARERRASLTTHMRRLVSDGCLLMLPAAPSIAPLKDAAPADVDSFRTRTLALTVIGGAAGLPQVTIPLTTLHGCPLGLGIIAPHGWDEELLHFASFLASLLKLNK